MATEAMVYLKALADGFETVVVCPEALDHDLTLESQFVLDPDEVQQDLSVQTGPMAPGAATSYSYPSEPTPQACLLRRCRSARAGRVSRGAYASLISPLHASGAPLRRFASSAVLHIVWAPSHHVYLAR